MLREFFVNEHPSFLFKPFGLIHNIFILLAFVPLIIIYIKRDSISKIPKHITRRILIICSIILLLNQIIYTFGNLYYGSFDYKENLPLHLCFIINYMFMFAILFKKYKILNLIFFLTFIGPTATVLWPDLVSTIDNYNFWNLVISHHFFINVSLFSYYSLGYKLDKKDLLHSLLFMYSLTILLIPFNLVFKTNYIFSSKIPDNVLALYPFLKPVPPLLLLVSLSSFYGYLTYKLIVERRNKELKI